MRHVILPVTIPSITVSCVYSVHSVQTGVEKRGLTYAYAGNVLVQSLTTPRTASSMYPKGSLQIWVFRQAVLLCSSKMKKNPPCRTGLSTNKESE